ncbi:MAG: LacI family DNA-binding transcriptional regulator [Anaerolineae bacterium]|nr:LacI family DNA-binding transcriptional regulator [Anaerolineae bacterium]
MPTIRDVAAHAQVSVATVSHVLNGTRFVDPRTVARVRHAIKVLGYRPNSLARGLRRNETSTIGMLLPDNSNPFFGEIARSIEDIGFTEDYNVILCNSDGSEAKEAAYVDTLLSKQIDGLILISSGNSFAPLQSILDAGVPCVVVDRELSDDVPVDQVLIDNRQGGYLAGQYLVQLGHRRIGYIAGPNQLSLSAQRLTGFRAALGEAGMALPDEAIVPGDFFYTGGADGMAELLRRVPGLTAVFAANDRMAVGAMSTLQRAGLRVPQDVSIIGYDDIPLASALYPSLTTIAQPTVEMGRTSVSLLIERIKSRGETLPVRRVTLPVHLLVRESCCPPRTGSSAKSGKSSKAAYTQ